MTAFRKMFVLKVPVHSHLQASPEVLNWSKSAPVLWCGPRGPCQPQSSEESVPCGVQAEQSPVRAAARNSERCAAYK